MQFGAPFVAYGQPTEVIELGLRTFHDPSAWEDLEAWQLRRWHLAGLYPAAVSAGSLVNLQAPKVSQTQVCKGAL